jgi:hypothetical protein
MKYLAHPEATLVTMWVTARRLSNAGPTTENELVAALRPPDLTSGEGLALKSSLLIGTDLGVFVRGEEATPRYNVGKPLKDSTQWFDEFDGFAHVVRGLLMSQADRPQHERSDVAIAFAWLLSRDWRRPNDPVSHDDGAPEDAVATPEQVVTFGRWCRELGVGRPSKNGVMADPTPAIRRDVAAASTGYLTALEFIDLLAATIPTGPRHRLAGRAPAAEDAPDQLELFSSVGFALKRLEREGLLRTVVRDDAKERIIYRFPGPSDPYVPVTHLEVIR